MLPSGSACSRPGGSPCGQGSCPSVPPSRGGAHLPGLAAALRRQLCWGSSFPPPLYLCLWRRWWGPAPRGPQPHNAPWQRGVRSAARGGITPAEGLGFGSFVYSGVPGLPRRGLTIPPLPRGVGWRRARVHESLHVCASPGRCLIALLNGARAGGGAVLSGTVADGPWNAWWKPRGTHAAFIHRASLRLWRRHLSARVLRWLAQGLRLSPPLLLSPSPLSFFFSLIFLPAPPFSFSLLFFFSPCKADGYAEYIKKQAILSLS